MIEDLKLTGTFADLELPSGDFLRPNGLGGYLISYSQLSAWGRCQMQKFYEDQAKADPEAPQPEQLSITSYGVVIHYCLQLMEQAVQEGRDDALDLALRTFEFYWHPDNIEAVAPRVTEWLPRQTYGGLRERGRVALRNMYDLLRKDEFFPLAYEYEFHVPIAVRGQVHTLRGFVDRLGIKKFNRKPALVFDDYKTGAQKYHLRWAPQGTVYAYASTRPEFWLGWQDSGLEGPEGFDADSIGRVESMFAKWGYSLYGGSHWELPLAARKFRWVNANDFKFADGGWRNERDYARLHLMVDAYVRSREASIYNLATDGQTCVYCAFRKTCGGVGLPHENAGAPA